jgi:hypothetical protein
MTQVKENIYKIFNDIQTRCNTKENTEELITIFEKNKVNKFNEVIEKVFLIIFKEFDKNNVALKNIKEFVKGFLEKIVKQKHQEKAKSFIEYFCALFTSSVKKQKFKTLCLYFLSKLNYF